VSGVIHKSKVAVGNPRAVDARSLGSHHPIF
jgi:hypothetical protein